MNIKINSMQIFSEHTDKIEETYTGATVKFLDKNIFINYNNSEIKLDNENKKIQIKRNENNIFVELEKEHENIYKTPYGNLKFITYGSEIKLEKEPFSLKLRYKIAFENIEKYENIIEITEI